MDDFFQQFESLLQPVSSRAEGALFANPYPIDLYEDGDNVVLEMAVPGLRPEQLDISLEGRQLSIRGTLPETDESEDGGRRYWSKAIVRGEFQRNVTVPAGVDPERITARVDQGLLILTMPKAAEAKARKIAIDNH
jgi:HSP20 family protein